MSDLAKTYLRQARSFLRAGDPQKAAELLDRARLLSEHDSRIERQVLEDMSAAYAAAGRPEQAARCRQRLEAMFPAVVSAGYSTDLLPADSLGPKSRRSPLLIGLLVGGLVLLVGAAIVTTVVLLNRNKHEAPAAEAHAGPAPATAVAAASPISVQPVISQPSVPSASSVVPVAAPSQDLFKETVGLVVVQLHYEGTAANRQMRFDLNWGTATAFAVHSSGVMLTNRHVTEAMNSSDIPPTLERMGLPTIVLRERTLLVCLGPGAGDRYPAKILHESVKCDMAVLQINHKFPRCLKLAAKPCHKGDDVFACGYPGIIQAIMDKSFLTPEKRAEILRQAEQTGCFQQLDSLSPDSFDSTLTKGIVSAPERNIDGSAYLLTDAAISQGNSGGPVLNREGEVLGIATLVAKEGKYGFAVLVDQFRDGLDYYIRDK